MPKSKFELFYDAVAENKSEDISRLIAEDEDIKRLFTQPDECDKLLSCAISSGHDSALITSLLSNMSDMKKFAPNALLLACKQGDTEVVKLLLDKKAASVNTTMASATALSNACLSGNKNLVELLLERGADRHFMQPGAEPRFLRNRPELRGRFALLPMENLNPAINAACAGGHIDIVKLLVAHSGPKICGFDDSMDNPYTSAVIHHQIEMLDYLLENYPLDVNAKIVLMDCICDANNPAIFPLLEKHGFMAEDNITIGNGWGERGYESTYYEELLRNICIKGSTQLLERLLESKPDLHNMVIRKTRTYPLCLAVSHGHADLVDRLIASGADLGVTNQYGYSPLHLACFSGQVDIIDRLLHTGRCDINAVTSREETALTLLFKNSDAVSLGIVDRLIMMGVNCNHQNDTGQTALILAILDNREDVVERLMSVGVDVNQADCENTPLMYAVLTGQVEIVKLLLNHPEIDLSITDSAGQTAIDMANDLNNPDINELFANVRDNLPSSSRP